MHLPQRLPPLSYHRLPFTKLALSLLCLLTIQACSSNKAAQQLTAKTSTQQLQPTNAKMSKTQQTRQSQLVRIYKQWQGTPYLFGGNSKKGIDCSAFVQQVYQAGFGTALPRTTTELARTGQAIKQQQLNIGDLVLFKTKPRVRHVGIYIGNKEFLHASSSQGVTLSKLDNVYWSQRYWQSRRILTVKK